MLGGVESVSCVPQPDSLLIAGDYEWAIVHVAWNRRGHDRTLLFAWVELLPAELPKPIDDGELCSRLGDNYVYLRHTVVTAQRAVDWYRECASGVAVRPTDAGELPKLADGVVTLKVSALEEEPPWPNVVCSRGELLPFAGSWYYCPRVHHALPTSFDLASLWTTREHEKAVQWLEEHLGFSFSEYALFWGSVHLVAPNPVFRAATHRLEASAQDEGAECILVHVQARSGHPAKGLHVRLIEERSTGVCVSQQVTLDMPTVAFALDHAVDRTALEIHDPKRGLLWHEETTYFLRQVQIQPALHVGRRIIRDGSKVVREVPLVSDMEPTSVGMARPTSPTKASVKLLEAATLRDAAKTARLKQEWFNSQHKEAVDAIHALLRGAVREVLIVDPYFGQRDLEFALGVSRTRVPVHVLTSAKGLASREGEGESTEDFVAVLDGLTTAPDSPPLEVRVMAGNGVHDRFVLVDDAVFLLGSSLRKFGSRGTMLVELPRPAEVHPALNGEWNKATPIRDWLDRKVSDDETKEKA